MNVKSTAFVCPLNCSSVNRWIVHIFCCSPRMFAHSTKCVRFSVVLLSLPFLVELLDIFLFIYIGIFMHKTLFIVIGDKSIDLLYVIEPSCLYLGRVLLHASFWLWVCGCGVWCPDVWPCMRVCVCLILCVVSVCDFCFAIIAALQSRPNPLPTTPCAHFAFYACLDSTGTVLFG